MLSVLESLPLPPMPRDEKQDRSLPWHFFRATPHPRPLSCTGFHPRISPTGRLQSRHRLRKVKPNMSSKGYKVLADEDCDEMMFSIS